MRFGMKPLDRGGLGIRRLTFCNDGILHFGLYFSFQILSNVSELNLPASRIFWFVVGSRGWAKGGDRAKSGRRSGRRASGLLGQTVLSTPEAVASLGITILRPRLKWQKVKALRKPHMGDSVIWEMRFDNWIKMRTRCFQES
jgi:hypothetical protein